MENKFTYYAHNTAKVADKDGFISNRYQLTPCNFMRFNNDKPENYVDKLDGQILAEFLGYSDFNGLDEEKYIKIL